MTTKRPLNILLVEDDFIIAKVTRHTLSACGYLAFHVSTGEAAAELVTNNEVEVDLVLMDIDLGKGMDGTMAAMQIKTIRDIPIIFHSSHTEQSIIEKTENISVYGYIPKNSSNLELDNAIKMALRLFKANQELLDQKLQYEDLYQNSPNGYMSITPDGFIKRINDTALSILAYSREDIVSKTRLTDLFSSQNGEKEENQFIESIFKINHNNMEVFFKRKDHTIVPVIFNSVILSDSEGKVSMVRATFSDNSKQLIFDYELRRTNYELEVHQIELELQNEELKLRIENNRLTAEKYELIFEKSPLGYISLDPSGTIMGINESGAFLFLKDKSFLIGHSIKSLLMPDSHVKFENFLSQVFHGDFSLSCELQIGINGMDYQDINLRKINVNENDRCFLLIFDLTNLNQYKTKVKFFNPSLK